MRRVDHRFLSELLEQKHVAYSPELYEKLYPIIWPCESFFKNFLMSSDPTLRLSYAKKIYSYMQSYEDTFLPTYMANEVISFQQHYLKDSSLGYVPQDHIIHSINLYILGIYLVFNVATFHRRLLVFTSQNRSLYSSANEFVKKWKSFAFYHDIGYFFEGSINGDGYVLPHGENIFAEYEKMNEQLLYHYVTRSVARLLTIETLFQKSTEKFYSSAFPALNQVQWFRTNGTPVKYSHVQQALDPFEGETLLYGVERITSFGNFTALFCKSSYLALIYNPNRQLCGCLIYEHNLLKDCFFQHSAIAEFGDIQIGDSIGMVDAAISANWSCKYVLANFSKNILASVDCATATLVPEFYAKLPKSLQLSFSLSVNDSQINQNYYETAMWLWSKSKHFWAEDFESKQQDIYTYSMSDYFKNAFQEEVTSAVKAMLQDHILENKNLPLYLTELSRELKSKETQKLLSKKINEKAVTRYHADEGIAYNIISYYANFFYAVCKKLLDCGAPSSERNSNFLSSLRFIHQDDQKISIDLFAHQDNFEEACFASHLYDRIQKLSSQLGIDFGQLKTYRTPFSACDHGIVSAGLLYQSTVVCNLLAEYSSERADLSFAWYQLEDKSYLSDTSFLNRSADVIFAILLHNIYTRQSAPQYGIKYAQDIEKNPFSYFCTFCDTLQKWNRPKQLNLASTDIPSGHYLGDNFDIEIENNRIVPHCSLEDLENLKSTFIDTDEYLPGASMLFTF